MTMTKSNPVMDLANTYAKYYVEDFAQKIMSHLRGTHAMPQEMLADIIQTQLDEQMATESLAIKNTSAPSRFLFECAKFALESNLADASSRGAWEHVSSLPSIHHGELGGIAYASADTYLNTMNQTVIGTIAKDADTTAKLIAEVTQSRLSNTETGGTFNLFSWGILNDGLWLNNALQRASDRASIFKDGATPSMGWAQTAFNFAYQKAGTKSLSQEARTVAQSEITLLLGNAPEEQVSALLNGFSQEQVNDLLFRAGSLTGHVSDWDKDRMDAKKLIGAVATMSTVARLLQLMEETAATMSNEQVGSLVRERLAQATETVTMALVGYEAMRETRFANTLIMSIEAEGNDPTVDVFVNSDTMASYRANNGTDMDLVHFGHHLDPRSGMGNSAAGYSLQYVMDRRETVIPKMMAETSDRLQKLRNNDATMIRQEASRIATSAVQTYLSHRSISEPGQVLSQDISRFARELTDGKTSVRMDERLSMLLAQAHGDPFVQKATDAFVGYMGAEGDLRQYAPAATIAHLAVNDAIDFVMGIESADNV